MRGSRVGAAWCRLTIMFIELDGSTGRLKTFLLLFARNGVRGKMCVDGSSSSSSSSPSSLTTTSRCASPCASPYASPYASSYSIGRFTDFGGGVGGGA